MAIDIKFDLAGNPEPPTIILATRSGQKLGQLEVEPESIDLSDKFNDVSEISFTLNKYINGELANLWDKVVNFKLIHCIEWDMWFEINVELDEETETIKTVFGKQLGQAELSQIMLYNIEINTEEDIARDDYKISILYDENNPEASILNRLLNDKAPHYSIIHVDPTIAKIQRMFSFDGVSICDAFLEISEEIGCLFIYHSDTDENGKIRRAISVYDLQQNCNDCGYRGEYTDKCPKCGSTNINNGYGEDTLIFVTADELASDSIELTTDTDAVKNCFKLEAGDDLMTATIRNCNPNGTDYIWYLSDAVKEDMSKELVDKINSYDEAYNIYQNNYIATLDGDLISRYNTLVDKYRIYNNELEYIESPIVGYSSLMNAYYNTIDLALYLQSALMPTVEMSDTNASNEAAKLTAQNLSPVSVNSIADISVTTADNAVLAMAKIIIDSRYRVKVNSSTLERGASYQIWTGNFTVTNYSDEEDTTTSQNVTIVVDDNYSEFVKQKIEKALNKEDTEDLSVSGLFKKTYNEFVLELKKYSLNCLESFYNSCQACIDILIEQGIADKETWSGQDPNLYNDLYHPYLQKMSAIEAEIKIRQEEVNFVIGVYDENDELITYGLQNYIEDVKNEVQKVLDFQKYLGTDLWLEFCTFRREDKYSNDNYISDGLDNAQIFEKALEFIEVAKNEIYKSAELQHSITTTLNNLLAISKFKPLIKSFKNGNWIRVQINDEIYKLRLLDYNISYGDFNNIPVTFSDVLKVKSGITDVQNVLSQASSMATSYDSVKRQSKQGDEAKGTIEQWFTSGLNSALVNIKNNVNEEIIFNNSGILARSHDDILDDYNPKQLRITHNVLALTEDNWDTVSLGIGEHDYQYYDLNGVLSNGTGYGVSAKFLSAGYINGSQIIGGEIYSQNYSTTSGTYMNLNDGTFSWAGGKIKYNGADLILTGVNLSWSDIGDAPKRLSAFENDVNYQNDIQVVQITKDTITAPYIKTLDLYVGEHIKMGENATISWSQVTGTDNIAKKSDVPSDEYITSITKDTVTTSYIKSLNLEVGNEILMGENAVISWNNITDQPSIPSKTSQLTNDSGYQNESQVTTITKNTITTEYIDALNITAGSVAAENITGTTITGKDIILGGEDNGDGSITVKDSEGAIICTINSNGIEIKSNSFIVTDGIDVIKGRFYDTNVAPNLTEYYYGGHSNTLGTSTTSGSGYVGAYGHTAGISGEKWGVDTGDMVVNNYKSMKVVPYVTRSLSKHVYPTLYFYGDGVLINTYTDGLYVTSEPDEWGQVTLSPTEIPLEFDISKYNTIRVVCETTEDNNANVWVGCGIFSLYIY